jgi:hypothetical protein
MMSKAAPPVRRLPAALALRALDGRRLGLQCVCGFAVEQARSEPVPERCRKCGRWWRR